MAARYHAPLDVRIEDVAEPVPAVGEIVLAVEAALTCGTDAKCYRRGHPLLLGELPAPFGHEYAGTVVAAGNGAPFAPADRVCGANSAPCGTCPPCRRGREELCRDLLPLLNGAYAERLLVPARIAAVNVHRIPPGVPTEVAAAVEPLACAIHAVEDAALGPGDEALVLGRGPLARLVALAATAQGAEAHLVGRDEPAGRALTVIEAAGSPEAWARALDLVDPGGTVIFFGGLPSGETVTVDAGRLHYDALTLRGSFHHRPRDVAAAVALIADDPAPVAAILTHEFDLSHVVEPLRRTAGLEPRDGLLKAVIRP
jgi:L-iditol 2-dehydrogenase